MHGFGARPAIGPPRAQPVGVSVAQRNAAKLGRPSVGVVPGPPGGNVGAWMLIALDKPTFNLFR